MNDDTDPEWWAPKVNSASNLMALLYGEGGLMDTLTVACLAGWDADNNATTSAGLLGLIHGYRELPRPVRTATDSLNPQIRCYVEASPSQPTPHLADCTSWGIHQPPLMTVDHHILQKVIKESSDLV
jgi:hypothetical protein